MSGVNWFRAPKELLVNLDNISHIWIEEIIHGFCVRGEMMHSGEKVFLSVCFPKEDEAVDLLKQIEGLK